MQTSGLLFIPDISGFTRFVTEMEIEHSRMIIAELLEVVIDANAIGLEISEIEGDAVLFYRFGECPDVRQLSEQVERMFRAFHARLSSFDVTRFCRCRACTSAVHDLTLKIVTHYGEFTSYRVKQFSKLIGRDVIVAHQLLKNDIDHPEYWLATPALCGNDAAFELPPWVRWSDGVKRTEEGDVPFRHTALGPLRRELPRRRRDRRPGSPSPVGGARCFARARHERLCPLPRRGRSRLSEPLAGRRAACGAREGRAPENRHEECARDRRWADCRVRYRLQLPAGPDRPQ
jgi:hypothetical protein